MVRGLVTTEECKCARIARSEIINLRAQSAQKAPRTTGPCKYESNPQGSPMSRSVGSGRLSRPSPTAPLQQGEEMGHYKHMGKSTAHESTRTTLTTLMRQNPLVAERVAHAHCKPLAEGRQPCFITSVPSPQNTRTRKGIYGHSPRRVHNAAPLPRKRDRRL